METTNNQSNSSSSSSPPAPQALPPFSAITNLTTFPEKESVRHRTSLPMHHPSEPRDSGNWSASKHSSGISNTGIHLSSLLNAEDSPSRNSAVSEHAVTVKSNLQPLPQVNSSFDNRVSQASLDTNNSLLDSRRSSVDSRVNSGISHLAISPSSPYNSQNVSRTSLVSNLQQQRGINTDNRINGNGPLSPLGNRSNGRPAAVPRRAPVINTNPRSVSGMPDPLAASPTKGYAWAFPDSHDPEEGATSSASSNDDVPSRQNSFLSSINSSTFTVDSSLPVGQKRFSKDMPSTHHHTLQRPSIAHLHSPDGMSPASTVGNYSRTPELRKSHKMAERRRRSEMKVLFDELGVILPASGGGKSSKWEILTRAIEYITKQKIEMQRLAEMQQSSNNIRSELEKARQDNSMLREELNITWQNLRRLEPNAHLVYGAYTSQLAADQMQQTHVQMIQRSLPSLPPPPPPPPPSAPSQTNWTPNPGMMQGVEYQNGHHGYDHR